MSSSTTRCSTRTHRTTSLSATAFPFLIDEEDRARGNVSAHHIDFMVGSPEPAVDGVASDRERVRALRNLAWQR